MLLYDLCTAVEFIWNEGCVVRATCYLRLISQCVIFIRSNDVDDKIECTCDLLIIVKLVDTSSEMSTNS